MRKETRRERLSLHREKPMPLSKIKPLEDARTTTGIGELDRLLGGGLVHGSAVLIGGDPGIGKSTLLLQAADMMAGAGRTVLYVTAEESSLQTKLRAERLGVASDGLLIVSETNLDIILDHIRDCNPDAAVIDSIQMVYTSDLPAAPGSVSQVRECAMRLVYLAKESGTSIFLVGHVTKGGAIAGPRTLEHMVDTVLYFEGDRFHSFRLLRAVKNRFGPTNEVGVFDMRASGLQEVENPSALFLSDDRKARPGTAVVPCIEGSRALLVEIQALTSRATYAVPERKVGGADYNRVAMLLAVLERRANMRVAGNDVFVNVVGGVKVEEPAADLGIAAAIASSLENSFLPGDAVLIGEVGLDGEVRGVTHIQTRLREAERLGFKHAYLPRDNHGQHEPMEDLQTHYVRSIKGLLEETKNEK